MLCLHSTYQPYDDSVVAHLGGGVQWGHAVISTRVGVSPTILHQVLDDLQVALLAGEVQRGGPCLGLGTQRTASGAQCLSPVGTATASAGTGGRQDIGTWGLVGHKEHGEAQGHSCGHAGQYQGWELSTPWLPIGPHVAAVAAAAAGGH